MPNVSLNRSYPLPHPDAASQRADVGRIRQAIEQVDAEVHALVGHADATTAALTNVNQALGGHSARLDALEEAAAFVADAVAGTGDAIVLTLDPALPAEAVRPTVRFQALAANTGPVTVDVAPFGPLPLRAGDGSELAENALTAGSTYTIALVGTAWRLAAAGTGLGDFADADEFASYLLALA